MRFGSGRPAREDRGSETRLFFCTDLHGSEICLRKLLAAERVYSANTLIMGGDCTGKQLVPIEITDTGKLQSRWSGETAVFTDEDTVAGYEQTVRNAGCYPVRLTTAELREIGHDSGKAMELFSAEMLATVGRWVSLATERLAPRGVHMIMTPGNDDEFAVDDVIRKSAFVDAAEGRITRIGRHELLSLGWSNPTPWHTPRECSEEELRSKIDALAAEIEDMPNAIFNIHVPPYGTGLDEAPELTDDQRPSAAVTAAVGSTAVREAILEYQPLVSLHGHIHESRGVQKLGRTVCINPGSVYGEGMLQGVTVDLQPGKVTRYSLTMG
jgi:uncharacterized protein